MMSLNDTNSVIPGLYPKDKTFYYCKLTDYKQVSFTCQHTGIWKLDLLKLFHPSCQTVDELRKLQPAGSETADSAKVSDQILLTLAGIYVLQKFYVDKKNCWTLVVNKAATAIIKDFQQQGRSVSKEDVQKMVDALIVNFAIDSSSYVN